MAVRGVSRSKWPRPELRPDPDHDAVCASQARRLVVVAPPGTGKTCLSVRLAGQLAAALEPSQRVLLLTFSNQARTQLEKEATWHLPRETRPLVEITNYHRFFWRGVRRYYRALGLPMNTQIGSFRRRYEALEGAQPQEVRRLRRNTGLLPALAEHHFERFRDGRTPSPQVLAELLGVVDREQRAGRLVFDDLGALFWGLLEHYLSVRGAYASRYPVVIADEHQDASELQDALVRFLGTQKRVILADPMQLIHGFRGASPERLQRHLADCEVSFELRTPHRWHGSNEMAEWLLAVRARLQGREAEGATRPSTVRVEVTPAEFGVRGALPIISAAISRSAAEGAANVAVLAAWNRDVTIIRNYLSRQGLKPRQIGGPEDFEEAREEAEQLPLLQDSQSLAVHALERLEDLVPTLDAGTLSRARARLRIEGIDFQRARGLVAEVLSALAAIYDKGNGAYFHALTRALDACARAGHHLPRVEAVATVRETAEALGGESMALETTLEVYAQRAMTYAHAAARPEKGLLVMTAHQAKGKEFDAIILANATERSFPDNEDGRKLFYVAITRATRSWTVTAPNRDATRLLRHL